MNLNTLLILMIVAFSCFAASCADIVAPVSKVEYAQVCTDANKDKIVTVEGFLGYGYKTPCLKRLPGNERVCGFKFLDTMNVVGKEIIAYLPEGAEKNQVETPDIGKKEVSFTRGFENGQIKFRLDDGTIVAWQENVATPVTITGKVDVSGTNNDNSGDKICSITTTKVEKR